MHSQPAAAQSATLRAAAVLALVIPLSACSSIGNLPELPDAVRGVIVEAAAGPPLLERLGADRPALTTSFDDADPGATLPATFDPGPATSLGDLPQDADGYVLAPGVYGADLLSFCLHAGTRGPSQGDGYLAANLAGPRADLVRAVLERAPSHPEISQHDTQALIWALLARADLDEASAGVRAAADVLLTPAERSGGDAVLPVVAEAVAQQLLAEFPEPARRVLEAELALRRLFASNQTTYAALEAAAVLPGVVPVAPVVERGRWSWAPGGYYIRYFPSGYSQTRVEVYVPDPDVAAPPRGADVGRGPNAPPAILASAPLAMCGVRFRCTDAVAVPAQTGAQRLGMSCPAPLAGSGERAFDHEPTSGAVVTNDEAIGTYLIGSYPPDLEIILRQLEYPYTPVDGEYCPPPGQRFNLLNVTDEDYEYWRGQPGGFFGNVNGPWIDKAVERGNKVIVVSAERFLRSSDDALTPILTGFGKEVHRLEWVHGYRYDPSTHTMLPPDEAGDRPPLTREDEFRQPLPR